MKSRENVYIRETFQALASRQIQVLDAKMWPRGGFPAWLKASDAAIKGVCWRNNSGAVRYDRRFLRFGIPGSPDILIMFRGGRLAGLEVKTDTGDCSETQLGYHAFMSDLGMCVAVVRGFGDTIRILENWGY